MRTPKRKQPKSKNEIDYEKSVLGNKKVFKEVKQ